MKVAQLIAHLVRLSWRDAMPEFYHRDERASASTWKRFRERRRTQKRLSREDEGTARFKKQADVRLARILFIQDLHWQSTSAILSSHLVHGRQMTNHGRREGNAQISSARVSVEVEAAVGQKRHDHHLPLLSVDVGLFEGGQL